MIVRDYLLMRQTMAYIFCIRKPRICQLFIVRFPGYYQNLVVTQNWMDSITKLRLCFIYHASKLSHSIRHVSPLLHNFTFWWFSLHFRVLRNFESGQMKLNLPLGGLHCWSPVTHCYAQNLCNSGFVEFEKSKDTVKHVSSKPWANIRKIKTLA